MDADERWNIMYKTLKGHAINVSPPKEIKRRIMKVYVVQ